MKKALFILLAFVITATSFSQTNYSLDKNRSSLAFSVKNFGVTHVDGIFKNFDVTMKSAKEDFTDADIEMTTDVKSISTGIDKRDKDLLSSKWLEADKYPYMIFKSSSFKKEANKNYKLEGKITIHGITKPIVFDVIYNEKLLNPATKKYSIRFKVTGKLNRQDFKVGTEALAAATADEVYVKSDIEIIMD